MAALGPAPVSAIPQHGQNGQPALQQYQPPIRFVGVGGGEEWAHMGIRTGGGFHLLIIFPSGWEPQFCACSNMDPLAPQLLGDRSSGRGSLQMTLCFFIVEPQAPAWDLFQVVPQVGL